MAGAAQDGARPHSVGALFRRVDAAARHVGPIDRSRLARLAGAGLLTILFVLALLAHAVVGLRSVLVDYVHTRARLVAAELLVRATAVVLGGAGVLAVFKLFLGR